jgi:hypothetical protein
MTWVWFFFLGIAALIFRRPIAAGMTGYSSEALKALAWGGLVFFFFMATFGVSSDVVLLHIVAAISGIVGFFAVSENTRRAGVRQSEESMHTLRKRLQEREEQRSRVRSPRPRNQPPLITSKDSTAHVAEILARASEEWDAEHEVQAGQAADAAHDHGQEQYRPWYAGPEYERAAPAERKQEPAKKREVDVPIDLARARSRLIEIITHTDEPPVETLAQVGAVQGALEPVAEDEAALPPELEQAIPRQGIPVKANLQIDSKLAGKTGAFTKSTVAPVQVPPSSAVAPSSQSAAATGMAKQAAGPISLGLSTGPRATGPVQLGASSSRFGGSGPISLSKESGIPLTQGPGDSTGAGTGYKPQVTSRLGQRPAEEPDEKQRDEDEEPAAS